MSDGDDIGVVIFMGRAVRGISGSIKNPTCCILMQRTRKRSGGRETVRRRIRKKEAEL